MSSPRDATPADAAQQRKARQDALSTLTRLALESRGSDELVEAAARQVAQTLGADRAAVIEISADADTVVMRGGYGWPAGTPLVTDTAAGGDGAPLDSIESALLDGAGAASILPAAWRVPDATWTAIAGVRGEDRIVTAAIVAVGTLGSVGDREALWFLEMAADILAGALERTRSQERARHQAMHDPLTNVANRTLFIDRVHHAVARVARSESTVALLFIDLDRFTIVNETLGHGCGDELLVAVAQRLQNVLQADDTLARLGGDEFAMLCEGLAGERGAIERAELILRALEAPIVVDEHEIYPDASIGVVVATARTGDPTALLRDAEIAMYRAKQQGGRRYELFDQAMLRRTRDRLDLERDIRRALDHNEFELHYQPIVSLDQHHIVGVEALVRWRHPQRGLVAPGAFIPIAEESGLIVPLGQWILHEACRQLARWTADPDIDIPYISVNLSGRQLAQPDLAGQIAQLLRITGVAPQQLALELTESVLMEETDSPTVVLEQLQALGVRLMLDDFGTGYSSLNYVKRFPIDAIKIDRSFIAGLNDDEHDRHILRAIVSLAAGFDLELIAEGVETADQARWLRHLGIPLAQGYGFARPAPAAATQQLLRDGLASDILDQASTPLPPSDAAAGTQSAPGAHDGALALTLSAAAAALGTSTSTLRRWADAGQIETIRTSGGHRRFPPGEVQRLRSTEPARRKPIVRCPSPPVTALPALGELLTTTAANLAAACTSALYDGAHTGWFASPAGRQHIERWTLEVAAAARAGNYDVATEATRKLLLQATHAGASLLERHTMLDRLGELIIRDLQGRGANHAELVGSRRLMLNLRQLSLQTTDRPEHRPNRRRAPKRPTATPQHAT